MPAFSVRLYRYPGPWQVQQGTDLIRELIWAKIFASCSPPEPESPHVGVHEFMAGQQAHWLGRKNLIDVQGQARIN
ncbi:hypothetical protein FOBRF1_005816 [Fusarium oxysporum]